MSAAIASAIASVAGPVLGGIMGSDASSSAANAQIQAAQSASQVQQNEFNQIQSNLQPWMTSGQNANALLSAFLGMPMQTQTYQQIYNQLAPQFTTTSQSQGPASNGSGPGTIPTVNPRNFSEILRAAGQGDAASQAALDQVRSRDQYVLSYGESSDGNSNPTQIPISSLYQPQPITTTSVDTAGLNAAVQNALARQNQLSGAASSIEGLGLKPFVYNESQDPMAQTMLDFGSQAIANQRSATGGVNSGATLQALSDYGQKTAASSYQQEYNNYYNRLNQIYSMLSGVSQSGQNAAAGVGNAGISTGNALASNMLGAGNAQAAGIMGGANSLSGALSGVSNGLLNQAFLGSFGSTGSTPQSIINAANMSSDPINYLSSYWSSNGLMPQ